MILGHLDVPCSLARSLGFPAIGKGCLFAREVQLGLRYIQASGFAWSGLDQRQASPRASHIGRLDYRKPGVKGAPWEP